MFSLGNLNLVRKRTGERLHGNELASCVMPHRYQFVHDWHHCMDFKDCKTCWNNCDQQLGPFPLNINTAIRRGSLVLTDIAWDQAITNVSKQCLVTWEVSGGGLMGNLLTDSSTVELSLWPDTIYHVQVTCKHKKTGGMRRSFKLIVDTHKLSDSTATGMQAMAMDSSFRHQSSDFSTEQANSAEMDSRMRILKDSSKDFLSPYNPNPARSVLVKELSSVSEEPTVQRTKITIDAPIAKSADFIAQSITIAAIGAMLLFLGLLLIFALTRTVRKELPAEVGSIDREVLLHREWLPSQTRTAAHIANCVRTDSTLSPASNTVVPDSRTLHV